MRFSLGEPSGSFPYSLSVATNGQQLWAHVPTQPLTCGLKLGASAAPGTGQKRQILGLRSTDTDSEQTVRGVGVGWGVPWGLACFTKQVAFKIHLWQ